MMNTLFSVVNQISIANQPALVFCVLAIITMFVAIILAPKYNLHLVRRIHQVDAMVEAAGAAAEMGKPLLFTPGNITPTFGAVGRDVPAVANVAKFVAHETAKLNVPMFITCADAMVHGMMIDYTRQAYIEEGHPERFRQENILWMPGGYSVVLGTIGVLEREDAHAVINWGVNWWGTQCPILETAVRRKAFLIAGQNWTGEGAMCAMFTDLVAICEELTAAGVYVSGDAVQGATLFGEDIVKIGLMVFMILYAILFVGGMI